MGTLGLNATKPFSRPVRPLNEMTAPDQIRGALNQVGKAITDHDADASLHLVTTTTAGVSSATAIASAIVHSAVAWVNGDTGAGAAFVDQVAWNGTSGTATAISATTTQGAPAARTYTVAAGRLTLAMAAGTYTITLIPVVFTT